MFSIWKLHRFNLKKIWLISGSISTFKDNINKKSFDHENVTCSDLQGSILDLLLFLDNCKLIICLADTCLTKTFKRNCRSVDFEFL